MSKPAQPAKLDYRRLKKQLNQFHKFSFGMPPKGKQFSPQQKSAITRKYNELKTMLKRTLVKETASFIPVNYKKIPKRKIKELEGVVTNKGIFFKYPNAKIKKDRKTGKLFVSAQFGKRRELFIPFPDEVKYDFDAIVDYVEKLEERYKPDYIRWSVYGNMASTLYVPEAFYKYAAQKSDEEIEVEDELKLANKPYYTGVFFGWVPGGI